jgi:hypothetical protein
MEPNKRYPILFAFKNFLSSSTVITLNLEAEDKSMEYIVLEPPYSLAFKQDDITNINSERGKYILIYRKKDCCDYCYFFDIET